MQQKEQGKSYKNSSKFRYYLWYLRSNGELYAYTDTKVLAKVFNEMRDMSIFIYKEKMLTSMDLRDIYEETPDTLLEPYKFDIGKTNLIIPITSREKLNLEHMIAQTLNVSLYCSAKIPPDIFTKRVQDYLKEIQYINVYDDYHYGKYNREQLKPDYITCFLTLFKDTMKKRW